MTTAQWALLVACASALFTGLNMLATWLNFRRVRPRVQTTFSAYTSDHVELALLVDLKNKGQYPIKANEEVTVWVAELYERPRRTLIGDIISRVHRSELDMMLDGSRKYPVTVNIPKGEERDVPAFGGTRFQVQLDSERYMGQFPDMKNIYARVDVTLSNGVESRSSWTPIHGLMSTATIGYLPRKE
ncbi:hypothetical protein OG601_24065 [Streptomyces sp. NBC_01239]|uniref:hypothetical protein n=1 Tax=Streptomyces sp. NBC_01239 TaxID=2903792 RepID=UPI00225327B6|nr:hypothetical protein [Streptomyces sp. NBC_01239]MCX4813678.1 hypothetical protein [Streptomyces sp. NBC_01239]